MTLPSHFIKTTREHYRCGAEYIMYARRAERLERA
jgi:hypothetical protein